ncbi:hypothetical protein [Haloplanus salinarum]|uniref:hypothetical protein n=1 Tax=Haloplanus salinarum TaxID=1912324 RepID=UPI00214CF1AA|nr:hypothetical protein [Haloplanus salinarum]
MLTLVRTAPASVLLSWTSWRAYRSGAQPNADPFLLLVTTLTLRAVLSLEATAIEVATVGFLEPFFDVARLGTVSLLPVAWIVYALSYAGRGAVGTRGRLVSLSGIVLPVVISAIALASDASEAVVGRVPRCLPPGRFTVP